MAQFEVGNVVQLKSGGPKMTIEHIYNSNGNSPIDKMLKSPFMIDGTICVGYFESPSNKLVKAQFKPEMLELVQ